MGCQGSSVGSISGYRAIKRFDVGNEALGLNGVLSMKEERDRDRSKDAHHPDRGQHLHNGKATATIE